MREHDVESLDFTVSEAGGAEGKYAKLDENDVYDAVLLGCERGEMTYQGKTTEVIRWNFELQDKEYSYEEEGATVLRVVQGTSSTLCNDRSKLYAWYKAMLGIEELEVGEKVSLSKLFGTECRIKIKNKKSTKARDDGTFSVFANVADVMRAKKTAVKKTVTKEEVEVPMPEVTQAPKKATTKAKTKVVKEVVEEKEESDSDDLDDIFGDL